MPSRPAMLLGGLLLIGATVTVAQRRGQEAGGRRRAHRVQHGQCSYTFVLPEPEPCPPDPEAFGGSNSLQRDSPAAALNLGDWPTQRVRQLEKMLENNTQWLQKVRAGPAGGAVGGEQLVEYPCQKPALGRKRASVTARWGRRVHPCAPPPRSALETRVLALETQQQEELASLRGEKERLRRLLGRQSGALAGLERSLRAASSNSSLLQRQQRQLLESVQRLVRVVTQGPASMRAAEQVFQDCAEIQRFGANASGIYTIHVANVTEPRKVFCDLEANGGGWTLIQRRENGSVNFQRNWKDYKQGFGNPAGEHWLGNEVVHQLTSRAAYSLRVELQDWEGNEAYAQYEHFQLGSEGQLYRLSLNGYSGSAGRQSSLVLQGTNFSTRDADNDNCLCKCAQMLSGGWWFDACGLSNLNGIYYPARHHVRKLNGIRWHYFQGPSYSLRATRMMVRPTGI
uniref:Fibrinogen C-terminal domain-containing protein n=1 Tax=Sus scrofa TaxID=9823 RepID=A0A8D0T246_PIG